MRIRRSSGPSLVVGDGERLLASAEAMDGSVLGGTRDAFYVKPLGERVRRVAWEQVDSADWDSDTETFRLREVGTWGEQRQELQVQLLEPRRLLELVRERVTASVVLQRHVAIEGRRGVRVIARRAPRGDQPVQWIYQYDEGIDPSHPVVVETARQALFQAQQDVGLG